MPTDPAGVALSPERSTPAIRPPRPISFAKRLVLTAEYLMRTDVHTFAFSVAANAILSFFPFMVLLMTLIRRVFHSKPMYEVVVALLRDYLPAGQEFIVRNLTVLIDARQRAAIASLVILLITSTGVFLPLEVALNRIWGFTNNRSYLGNLLVSLALAFGCGCLALLSIALSAGHHSLLMWLTHGKLILPVRISTFLIMKLCALVTTIIIFFLIYWVLPNGKTPPGAVLPAAIVVGLVWEGAKYLYVWLLPRLNFAEVYGPFSISVTLMFWAFISGLLLLGGAHLSAANRAWSATD